MEDDSAGVLFLRSGIRTRRGADRLGDGCLWLRDGSKDLSMPQEATYLPCGAPVLVGVLLAGQVTRTRPDRTAVLLEVFCSGSAAVPRKLKP